MGQIKNKVHSLATLKQVVAGWKVKGQKIVFTNGCFDIIHLGHIDYLEKASKKGERLIVGINTDSSVNKIKGNNRPIQDETSRAMIIAAMSFVDAVVLFDDNTPQNLINEIIPNILVKGADYEINDIVGAKTVLKAGGIVETIDFLDGYSTSAIEKKILLNKK